MPNAVDVAKCLVATNFNNPGIRNRLSRLCARAQGVCLAHLGEPLFDDAVEMREDGWHVAGVEAYRGESDPSVPPELDLDRFSMRRRLVLAGVGGSLDVPVPFVGGPRVATHDELKSIFADDPLIGLFRRAEAAPVPEDVGEILSGEEFWERIGSLED